MAISKGLELAISNLFVSPALSTELQNLLNNSSSGGIAWRPPVRVLDSVSTIMPLAGPVTIDDVVMQNGDRILYTNLSDPEKNNRVYKIVGLTGDLRLILEVDKLPGDGSPSDGDSLIVEEGTDNADRVQIFDGTAWGGLSVGPTGDTFGPASSVDYAIARFDGTTGKLLQQSPVLINDSGSFFWTPDNVATIGQAGDNRPKRVFVAENIDIGNIVGGAAGFLHAGVGSTLYTITGSDNGNQAIMCFTTTLANAGFVHDQGDPLGTIKIFNNSGGYADYFKFNANAAGGAFTLMKSAGAHILWNTDGAGNIGALGANRPANIYIQSEGFFDTAAVSPLIRSASALSLRAASNVDQLLLNMDGSFTHTGASGQAAYQFTRNSNTRLAIQSKSAGTAMAVWLFANDGDGTDQVLLNLVGLGTPTNVTNSERLNIGWDVGGQHYRIQTTNSGTGVVRPLTIFTGANNNQLLLNTDRSISLAGGSSQTFTFSREANFLNLRGQTTSVGSYLNIFSFDGDGTDFNGFQVFAKGTNAFTGQLEWLGMYWNPSTTSYNIQSQSLNGGTNRQISIECGANANQLLIKTDGNIGIQNSLVWNTDGTGSVGLVGANRPYSVNVYNDIEVGGASGTHLNSQQIYGPVGSAGTPTFSFNTANMGIYASSGTAIGLTFFGTQGFEFSATHFKLYDASSILWSTDGGGDIGAAGANRPNNIYAKTDIHATGGLYITRPGGASGFVGVEAASPDRVRIKADSLFEFITNGNVRLYVADDRPQVSAISADIFIEGSGGFCWDVHGGGDIGRSTYQNDLLPSPRGPRDIYLSRNILFGNGTTTAGIYTGGSGATQVTVANVWKVNAISGGTYVEFLMTGFAPDNRVQTDLALHLNASDMRFTDINGINDGGNLGLVSSHRPANVHVKTSVNIGAGTTNGVLNMNSTSGANILWGTDGGGNIGASGVNRPNNIYAKTQLAVETNGTALVPAVRFGTSGANGLFFEAGLNGNIALAIDGSKIAYWRRSNAGAEVDMVLGAGVTRHQFLMNDSEVMLDFVISGANRYFETRAHLGSAIHASVDIGKSPFSGVYSFRDAYVTNIGIGYANLSTPTLGSNNVLWGTDGAGNIGAVAANRPNHIYAKMLISMGGITTAVRDGLTPSNGMIIYNSDTGKHQGYNGIWNDMY